MRSFFCQSTCSLNLTTVWPRLTIRCCMRARFTKRRGIWSVIQWPPSLTSFVVRLSDSRSSDAPP
eukprot:1004678-Pyramimonas_sp.AAC.1